MKIIHRHGETQGAVPHRDALAEYAVKAYGHVLNTPGHRNRWHNGKEFAEAIAEVYDVTQPLHSRITEHLKALP